MVPLLCEFQCRSKVNRGHQPQGEDQNPLMPWNVHVLRMLVLIQTTKYMTQSVGEEMYF